jgi:hypothetical protein
MRSPRAAALALLLATLAACEAHRPAATAGDGIVHDSGRCDAVCGGTNCSECHWHRFSVGVDPGTAFSRAIAERGVTEVPVVLDVFPARWLSLQAGTGPGPTWPSPLTLAARVHACGDAGCTWYVGGYWEPWRKSQGLVHRWVLGASIGYRFENHLIWSSPGKCEDGARGMHLYAAPALAFDLWSQSPDAPGLPSLSPHLQLAVGWSF